MVALSFASVPLYRLFCQVTGFGGTTMRAEKLPDTVLDRTVTIHFDANTSRNINWSFQPENQETVKLGQQGLISFNAENADVLTAGTAVYNVTPAKVSIAKICFCFWGADFKTTRKRADACDVLYRPRNGAGQGNGRCDLHHPVLYFFPGRIRRA